MNINNYAPKHVNLDSVKSRAKTYLGTFAELYTLVKEGNVTLTVTDDGTINGFWVDSKTNDVMLDTLSGYNFSSAYCCKPTMKWLEIILNITTSNQEVTEINETTGLVTLANGEQIRYKEASYSVSTDPTLPSEISVDVDDLDNDTSFSSVRNYLKSHYGYCLARGIQPNIESDGKTVKVTNIVWGRKLSDSELASL